MEKLNVTQKQFDWLERYKSAEEIDFAINIQPHRKRPDSPIVDWEPSKVAYALYIGYEVEPEFMCGDWVKSHLGNIFKIIGFGVNNTVIVDFRAIESKSNATMNINEIASHATPEEIAEEKTRRWWFKNNRAVGELKKRDLVLVNGDVKEIYDTSDEGEIAFCGDSSEEPYYSKCFAKRLKVVCFAEDRKDLGDTE